MSISLKAYLLGCAAVAVPVVTVVAIAAGPGTAPVDQVSYDLGYATGSGERPGARIGISACESVHQMGLSEAGACHNAYQAEFLYFENPILHPGPTPASQEDYMAGCYDGLAELEKI